MTMADNTNMSSTSTPMCVEQTQECTEIVLARKRRRWYAKNMTKKPIGALKGIRPEHMRAALARSRFAESGGKGHSALARHIGSYQQAVRRILEGEVQDSGPKWPIVQALSRELWEVALEKNDSNLKNELSTHGLQPKSDDAMTIIVGERSVGGDQHQDYTFDLFEPWVARGDASMSFAARAASKILPPSYPHSKEAYAFRMKTENMVPRIDPGMICEVDPAMSPQMGDDCIFYNADRSRGHVGRLAEITATHWHCLQLYRQGDIYRQAIEELPIADWPTCEKITNVRRP